MNLPSNIHLKFHVIDSFEIRKRVDKDYWPQSLIFVVKEMSKLRKLRSKRVDSCKMFTSKVWKSWKWL